MSYFILSMTITLILAMVFHLKYQFHKTASVRQDLRAARRNEQLTDMRSLGIRRD